MKGAALGGVDFKAHWNIHAAGRVCPLSAELR
jgi:hypothetical protein